MQIGRRPHVKRRLCPSALLLKLALLFKLTGLLHFIGMLIHEVSECERMGFLLLDGRSRANDASYMGKWDLLQSMTSKQTHLFERLAEHGGLSLGGEDSLGLCGERCFEFLR